MHGTIGTEVAGVNFQQPAGTVVTEDPVATFREIAEIIRTSPDVVVTRNNILGGDNYTLQGVTLVDNSVSPTGGSPFLKMEGEEGFLVQHTLSEGFIKAHKVTGRTEWVEGRGQDEAGIKASLAAMRVRLG